MGPHVLLTWVLCRLYTRMLICFSRVWLGASLQTVALQAPLSMGFFRQEYWSPLPSPPPGDLPELGIKPKSPSLQVDSLLLSHQGSPFFCNSGSHSVSLRPTATASPRYLEMQILQPHFKIIESETLGVRTNNMYFKRPPTWFVCMLKFENHWFTNRWKNFF